MTAVILLEMKRLRGPMSVVRRLISSNPMHAKAMNVRLIDAELGLVKLR